MNPEERSLLERIYNTVEENNILLKSLRRSSRIGSVLKLFYWIIIIGLSLGSFYFIKPYIDSIKNINVDNSSISPINSYEQNIHNLLK